MDDSGTNVYDDGIDLPIQIRQQHRLRFVRDVFDPADDTLATLLADADSSARLLVFIDAGVAQAYPGVDDRLAAYLAAQRCRVRWVRPHRSVVAGEAIKNNPDYILPLLGQIAEAGIDRQSFVMAIGGGAVLDAVGFAAALAHRGVRLIRLPTTTLAQADSGVGVKNGINAFDQKNFIGTFAVPWGVVNSLHWLDSLPDREWRSGLSEVVKVALLRDVGLFELVESQAHRLRQRDPVLSAAVIQRSAILHARHVAEGGDPFEQGSSRPLDFGHWAAHRLERMTSHAMRHGEAVSIGLAIDCIYAARIGLLARDRADRVLNVLTALGLPVAADPLRDIDNLMKGLNDFREHLGGRLTLTMLRDLGDPVSVHEVDGSVMADAVQELLDRVPAVVVD